jgi:hypothetical protein
VVNINPALTSQTLCQNAAVNSYSVSASAGSGTISSYSWYKNANNSNTGGTLVVTNTSALTSNTYTPSTASAGTLYYYCIVTNSNGCIATSTPSGSVNVIASPTITTTGIINTLTSSVSNQSATLPYTATTISPINYSIDWDATANAAGLADQATTAFTFAAGGGNLTGIVITPATTGITYNGVMTIKNSTGCSSTQAVKFTILNVLDVIGLNSTTPAASAYSLRKLSLAYAGPLVRITIGTSYYDVYPDTAGAFSLNSLISSVQSTYNAAIAPAGVNTLNSIVTVSTTAKVAIWYDQSGYGNHASQATTSIQPRIINAGVIDKDGSNPAILFTTASSQFLQSINNVTISGASSANAVSKAISPANNNAGIIGQIFPGSGTLGFTLGKPSSSSLFGYGVFNGGAWQASNTNANYPTTSFVATGTYGGTTVSAFLNGVANTTATATASIVCNQPLLVGKRWDTTTETYNGYISETMVFASTLSTAARQSIECNQGGYYAISVANCATSIVTQPVTTTQTICKNSTAASIKVEASGANLTYQWYSNTTASTTNSTLVPGATSATYSPSSAVVGTLYYYVVVSGTIAPLSVTSGFSGAITTIDLPTITASSSANTACFNASVQTTSLTYSYSTNNPTSYSIDWDATANTAGLADQTSTNFTFSASGGTITGLVIAAGALPGTYNGILKVSNANGCFSTYPISILINGSPSFSTVGSVTNPRALNFDGSNDFLSVTQNNTLDITTAITMEAWVYPIKSTGIQNVMSKSSSSQNNGYIFPRTDNGWNTFVVYL